VVVVVVVVVAATVVHLDGQGIRGGAGGEIAHERQRVLANRETGVVDLDAEADVVAATVLTTRGAGVGDIPAAAQRGIAQIPASAARAVGRALVIHADTRGGLEGVAVDA